MKILLIGSGGREHALVQTLLRTNFEQRALRIFCAPGNDGIMQHATCIPLAATNVTALARFAEEKKIDLTIVGGETALAEGIVDEFERRGLMIAGPNQAAARLESSKAFAKNFMARHGVPTAPFRLANSIASAREILRSGEFGAANSPVVVKADGLAGGKGVVVAATRAEAESAVADLMQATNQTGNAEINESPKIVIEEALAGREASLLVFADGMDYRLMPAARDHKRVGEGDTGPNTGGMGAITAHDVLDEKTLARVAREVIEPTLEGARSEGFAFRGILFVGLMLTAEGPRVLEYNVRFGDPEAQAILMRLESDLTNVFEAMARGKLGATKVLWSEEASAAIVLAARGYPTHPETGAIISGLEDVSHLHGVEIFHAGTKRAANGEWLTAGGRVLNVATRAATLEQALERCYAAVAKIHWDGMHFRRDIGKFA